MISQPLPPNSRLYSLPVAFSANLAAGLYDLSLGVNALQDLFPTNNQAVYYLSTVSSGSNVSPLIYPQAMFLSGGQFPGFDLTWKGENRRVYQRFFPLLFPGISQELGGYFWTDAEGATVQIRVSGQFQQVLPDMVGLATFTLYAALNVWEIIDPAHIAMVKGRRKGGAAHPNYDLIERV